MNTAALWFLIFIHNGSVTVVARFTDEAACRESANVLSVASSVDGNVRFASVYPRCLKLPGAL